MAVWRAIQSGSGRHRESDGAGGGGESGDHEGSSQKRHGARALGLHSLISVCIALRSRGSDPGL